jgi:hypothetical protein
LCLSALAAPPIDFQPMSANLKVMGRGYVLELPFNVAASQIFGYSTNDAQQMMVMALEAQLIPQVAIL